MPGSVARPRLSEDGRRLVPDLAALPAHEVMRSHLVTASAHESVAMAWQLVRSARTRHLPVLDEGRLLGLVTPEELLVTMSGTVVDTARTVGPLAATPAQASPDTSLHDVARLMTSRGSDVCAIVEDSRLVGLVTATDIVAAFAAARATTAPAAAAAPAAPAAAHAPAATVVPAPAAPDPDGSAAPAAAAADPAAAVAVTPAAADPPTDPALDPALDPAPDAPVGPALDPAPDPAPSRRGSRRHKRLP